MKGKGFWSVVMGVAIAVVLVGCSKTTDPIGGDSLYTPTTADVTASATLAQLQEGRSLYVSHCASCHSLFNPDNYPAASWRAYVGQYGPRVGLNSAQQTLVALYGTRGR